MGDNVTKITTARPLPPPVAPKPALSVKQRAAQFEVAASRSVQETVRAQAPKDLPVTYVSQAETGIVWGKGIQGQGLPFEEYVARTMPAGSRLPQNYKTFDFHDDPTKWALSVKTLDTMTPSRVAKPKRVYHKMKKDIDAVVKFAEHELSRKKLTSDMISQREIHLAVPAQTTSTQWAQVSRAVQYAETQGVKVKITAVEP